MFNLYDYENKIYKIEMMSIKYNLYYMIKEDIIMIINIKSFKEKQLYVYPKQGENNNFYSCFYILYAHLYIVSNNLKSYSKDN